MSTQSLVKFLFSPFFSKILNELTRGAKIDKLKFKKIIRKKRQNDKSRIPTKIVDFSSLEFYMPKCVGIQLKIFY